MSERLQTLIANGRFHCRETFDRRLCWDDALAPALVEKIWNRPHGLLSEGVKLQDKPRCTVVRLDEEAGTFVWKHHNWGTAGRTVKRSLARSTAQKTWADGIFLSDHGVPTPRPRAFFERRLGPFQRFSYALNNYVPGTSLYRLMRFERPGRDLIASLAEQVAAIWQRLDELCVWHNDFKTENLLVDPQGQVWLIDLERTRRYSDRQKMRRRQARDAGDLLHPRNWRANPDAAEIFRQAILRTPAARETLQSSGMNHPLRRAAATGNSAAHLVTVIIPTRNADPMIVPCLESVRDMADEIIVADAGSTDDTVQLAREFGGCRVLVRESDDPAAFEAWAQSHARHPWILRILPNELLNPDLGRQVQDTLAADPQEDGFEVSRAVHFRGRRLNHGDFRHDASIRLYRGERARYELRDGQVEVSLSSNRIGSLRGKLVHEACFTIERHLQDLFAIAERAAKKTDRRGERPKRANVLLKAPWQFVRSYFLRHGWMDGWAGLHASYLAAFETYLRETLLWSLQRPSLGRHLAGQAAQTLRVYDPGLLDVNETPSETAVESPYAEHYVAPPSQAAA